MRIILGLLLTLLPAGASIISSVGVSDGTPSTVTYDTFEATEPSMDGLLQITATFGDGSTATCTWANASPNCSSPGNFSVSYNNDANTFPPLTLFLTNWTITNLNPNLTLAVIEFNGLVGSSGVAFDRCMSTNTTPDDDNSSCLLTGAVGTLGSSFGYSAGSNFLNPGTAGIQAVVLYTNILNLAGNPAVGDAYGVMRLTFGGTNSFTFGETFTFYADTDLLSSTGIPEPGTFVFSAIGLGTIAVLRRRSLRRAAN